MLSIDDRRGKFAVPTPFNLAGYVLWSNDAAPDKIALTILKAAGSERWSYGRLRDAVLTTAAGLLSSGLAPGDRLLLRLGNSADFPLAFLGSVAAGIVPVPTSAALTGAEIDRIAEILAPRAVLAAEGIALPHGIPAFKMADVPKNAALAECRPAHPEDPAYVVFTSGTSGAPLGVVHAHRAILARRFMFDGWYGLEPGDRLLHAGAFNWTYTLGTGLLDPWTIGASALILDESVPSELVPLLARRHEATILAGAPGIFRRFLREGTPELPKLRHGLSAGEKLPASLRSRWRDATGTDLHEAFGQSECSTFISGAPQRPAPDGTLGFVQDGRAVAILGTNGPLARGETGEIAVHRSDPGLMLRYLGEGAPHTNGEWFTTGDMGVMREDGAIFYVGRIDDVLTAGGFRLSPIEIEDAMHSCPGILDAAAVDHRLTPETTVVALHYAAAEPIPDGVLAAHAAERLAHHKQPRVFVHHASLPRNSNGKLLRRRLRLANEAPS